MEVKKYTITCLDDMLKIPVDRIDAFLRDLNYGICVAHLSGMSIGEMEWRDDGDHSVDLFEGKADTPFLSLNVTDGERCSHPGCGTPTQPGPCDFDACPRK